ncbi:MAG: glycosyltransferase [Micrococcales bacterium]|nr:glycosyltransferase [Micrococcales bacterium]
MPRGTDSTISTRGSTPTVVYIAGSGRSGSTLLERSIGAVPGYVNVGELLDLPRRVVPRDELCGCGEAFSRCTFWTAVGQRLPEGWSEQSMAHVHRLQTRVARQRFIPQMLIGRRTGRYADNLTSYATEYARLYRAITDESGDRYVVDASKWPSQALALKIGGIDVRVIHLVRDVRGVAYSLSRNDIARPQAAQNERDVMFSNVPASAAARWTATQTEADLLGARGVPVARMRYDDFVDAPGPTVSRALHALRLEVTEHGLDHIDGTTISLGPSHGLSGNPSRFRHGDVLLRPDTRWKQGLSRRDRIVVGAIGAPQLLRTSREPLHRSAATAPRPGTATTNATRDSADPSGPNEWPVVSVVLPTHGRPELVRDAITSVAAQTYPGAIELLVVHDREEEDPSLAGPSRDRLTITVMSNTRSPGLAGARNSGLERATGEFIATLDDDDTWHPTKLERQVARFHSDPDILALGAGIRLILPEGRSALWPGRDERITYQMLLRNRVKELHSSTLIMRRDAFAKAGEYDEGLPNGYAEDYDFVLRVARVGRIGVVCEPLADIRKDGHSYYRGRAANTAPALAHFLAKHPEIAEDRRGHARMLGQMAFAHSCLGDRSTAATYAAKAVARWPLSPHPYVAFAHIVSGVEPTRFASLARRFGRGMA